MAKIEPGSYKASDNVRVFDDVDDGDDGEEGSRLPLLIVIALLVLAAFGGVVWLAYSQGVQRGRADAPRPLLADSQTAQAPGKGVKVYEQPAPPDTDAGDEDNTPPPTETKPATPPPSALAQATKPPVTAPPPAASSAMSPPETAVVTKPPQQLATPTPKPAPRIAPKPPEDTLVATPPPAATPVPASGDYVLQIGAYKSEDEANAAWKTYQHKHPLLGGYGSDVKKVDLADKGVWYRLRVGAFPTKDAAGELCTKLKADGGDCLLAKK